MKNKDLNLIKPRIKIGMSEKRKAKLKDLTFYIVLLAIPVVQFSIFYVGVNIKSFLFAFQSIDMLGGTTEWVGFKNFADIFNTMKTSDLYFDALLVSLKAYGISLFVGVPLGLFFSFYIAEKMPGHGFFRVALFLPSIISSITMVTIFRFFANNALPDMLHEIFGFAKMEAGLIDNPETRFGTVAFYNILISFGTSVLMYSNSMNELPPEVNEAARLDGAQGLKKFWYIMFPQVYGTLTTFLIVGVAGIFTNQMNVFSFYASDAKNYADLRTIGYYMFQKIQSAGNEAEYPQLAALGLLCTAIAVPLTMLVKWLLNKVSYAED